MNNIFVEIKRSKNVQYLRYFSKENITSIYFTIYFELVERNTLNFNTRDIFLNLIFETRNFNIRDILQNIYQRFHQNDKINFSKI